MKKLILLIVAIAIHSVAHGADTTNPEQEFKVMIVHPVGRFEYHKNDLNWGLEQNGITFKHYGDDDPAAIATDIDGYDMLMCTPLVNLNNALCAGAEKFRTWIAKGNALVVTDVCNSSLVNPWLSELLPDSPLGNTGCVGAEQSPFVRDITDIHPLRAFPERLDYESRQWHCLKTDGAWESVALCSGPAAIHPVTVMHQLGDGIVYVSSMQQRWRALSANLRAQLRLRRLGFKVTRFSSPPFVQGANTMALSLEPIKNEKQQPIQFRLRVRESDEINAETTGGATVTVRPSKEEQDLDIMLHYNLPKANTVFLELSARTPDSGWVRLFAKNISPQAPFAVMPPRYRGILSSERRTQNVSFEIKRCGETAKTRISKIRLTLLDANSRQRAQATITVTNCAASTLASVPVPRLLPGEYQIRATAYRVNGTTSLASTNFVVRAPSEHLGETIIDEDGVILVDGKPFFPLGVYHLYPEAYAEVAKLGFNTVQTFQWMTRQHQSLNEAEALGLKVIFEKNDKTLLPHKNWPAHIRNHPALLMWYAPDEPLHEPDHDFAMKVAHIYREGDPFHPVLRVNFNLPRYPLDTQGCDIFAPYSYPLKKDTPPEGQAFWKIKQTIDAGRDAAGGLKPLLAVLPAFGHESSEDLRICAWLAITQDVRGILWYAWDERNGTGLVNFPETQTYLGDILKQLREISPSLLAPSRHRFEENGVYGLLCRDKNETTLVVLNMTAEERPMPQVGEFKRRNLKSLFHEIPLSQPLAPFEERVYRNVRSVR